MHAAAGERVRIIADHLVSNQDPRTVAWRTTVHPNFQVRHYRPTTTRITPLKWQTVDDHTVRENFTYGDAPTAEAWFGTLAEVSFAQVAAAVTAGGSNAPR